MLVNKIYLSWRKSTGNHRHLVGELYRHYEHHYTFKYLKNGVTEAKKDGFIDYPDFPNTDDTLYTENIKHAFFLRLIPEGRADRSNFLAFWEARDPRYDWFDELALTQGLLPTDNFEFLGVFNPPKVKSFVTDLASVGRLNLPRNTVSMMNRLTYIIEDNNFDETGKAVKVLHGEKDIGYIKKVHNRYFFEAEKKGLKPTIEVKAVSQNGIVKGVYLKVYI